MQKMLCGLLHTCKSRLEGTMTRIDCNFFGNEPWDCTNMMRMKVIRRGCNRASVTHDRRVRDADRVTLPQTAWLCQHNKFSDWSRVNTKLSHMSLWLEWQLHEMSNPLPSSLHVRSRHSPQAHGLSSGLMIIHKTSVGLPREPQTIIQCALLPPSEIMQEKQNVQQ